MTKRDRRSSLTENQKEEVLEKRRRAYEIRRARVREASNNEHRAGPSSGNAATFLPRRSPRFTEQTQFQDNEQAVEASRKRKGKSVVIWEKRRRPNNDIPGRKAGAIVIRSTGENNSHHSRDYSSSEDGEQELVDSGVPHQSGKENINIQVGPISGNHGTGKETTTPTATSIETGKALSKDSSGGDFRKRPRKKTKSEVVRCCIPDKHIFKSLTLSLKSKQEVEEDRAARRVQNRMNRFLRLQESLIARRRSSRIEQARLIRENLSCDGLVDVPVRADIPLTFSSSEVGGFFDLP
ncbi:hypothetical protein MKW98_026219 [Papaver atlanticum]|uniref:Uncharacterized protein n=1 Tax=Papaver atlanticum TaxID=357466 RepID=A0AAD4T340_9MAGN|nr:hypothetical protein MKW98_026219 [Papaver atlanticum]